MLAPRSHDLHWGDEPTPPRRVWWTESLLRFDRKHFIFFSQETFYYFQGEQKHFIIFVMTFAVFPLNLHNVFLVMPFLAYSVIALDKRINQYLSQI